MKLRTIALRNMTRNRRRTILSLVAIAISALCFIFLFSLLEGMKQDLTYNLQTYYNGEIRIRHNDYDKFEQLNPLFLGVDQADEVISEIKQVFPEALVSPRISFPSSLYREDEDDLPSLGWGVDFSREDIFADLAAKVIQGRIPQEGADEVLMTPGLMLDAGIELGDEVTFLTQTRGRGSNAFTLKVVGIIKYPVASLNKMTYLAPLDRIQAYLKMGESVTEILIKGKAPLDKGKTGELNNLFASRGRDVIGATHWTNIESTFSYIATAESTYSFMAIIFFLLGATVIANTTMMVIFERTREIGTIAALGMTGKQIIKLFFLEALFIAVIGSLTGVIVGSLLTLPAGIYGLNFGDALAEISWEASPVLHPKLTWFIIFKVFILSTLVAALASFLPSRRAARVNPIEALRSE